MWFEPRRGLVVVVVVVVGAGAGAGAGAGEGELGFGLGLGLGEGEGEGEGRGRGREAGEDGDDLRGEWMRERGREGRRVWRGEPWVRCATGEGLLLPGGRDCRLRKSGEEDFREAVAVAVAVAVAGGRWGGLGREEEGEGIRKGGGRRGGVGVRERGSLTTLWRGVHAVRVGVLSL